MSIYKPHNRISVTELIYGKKDKHLERVEQSDLLHKDKSIYKSELISRFKDDEIFEESDYEKDKAAWMRGPWFSE